MLDLGEDAVELEALMGPLLCKAQKCFLPSMKVRHSVAMLAILSSYTPLLGLGLPE